MCPDLAVQIEVFSTDVAFVSSKLCTWTVTFSTDDTRLKQLLQWLYLWTLKCPQI